MPDENPTAAAARILVVDDLPANLDLLGDLLEGQGYNVHLAPSGSIALKSARKSVPDLVLLDVTMPEMDGFEVCRKLKQDESTRDVPVVFITARDDAEDLVRGFRAGGVDYITKPFNDEEVVARVETHVRLNRLARELAEKNAELASKNQVLQAEIEERRKLSGRLTVISEREEEHWGLKGFVGESAIIHDIFKDVRLMQEHARTSVLITGENGTGKELIARAIHFGSPRRDEPFVPVNCNAIPDQLVESTLFGHVKGSFTGATEDRPGSFEMADGGTLFLDEIGDMPVDQQGKLLRVLEDGEVWRVGAKAGRKVDVRVVAATNADLEARIADGKFRQDFYYRLARYTVEVPPLRERPEDIPLLANHFARILASEMGYDSPGLTPNAVAQLRGHPFPGNVRELKNVIERALIESGGTEIEPGHLRFLSQTATSPDAHEPDAADPNGLSLPMDLDQAARIAQSRILAKAIDQADGNLTEAARILGTTRNRLYRVMGRSDKSP